MERYELIRMKRFKPLLQLAVIAFIFALSTISQAANRPNILFCIADDWAWPHAGIYGDKTVQTPTFDRLAREGALFSRAYSAAPSCTPSRAAILTGRTVHSLEEGANLHGTLPKKYDVYPDILERNGYFVGHTGKGWGPGRFDVGGRTRNPAGPAFKSFADFLSKTPTNTPFCFWFGSLNPHRPYEKGAGAKEGKTTRNIRVPGFWPDNATVENDILDYYTEVETFDQELAGLVKQLETSGQIRNTVIVVTGDNGWPFPRGKANVYDAGSHQPLAVYWPGHVKAGLVIDEFVNLYELTPTFLQIAGVDVPKEMHGRSLIPLLSGKHEKNRDHVFVERERHANVRAGDLGYPVRAVRTKDFLYIRNMRPDRWPAGDPEMWKTVGPFGDCDASPTKEYILDHRTGDGDSQFFKLCFDKRPAEELYDLKNDTFEVINVADNPKFAAAKKDLRASLDKWMKETGDPRATADDDRFDKYPYLGGEKAAKAGKQNKP